MSEKQTNTKGDKVLAIRVISRLIMAIFGKIAYVAYKSRVKVRVKVNISTHMIIWYDCILFELCLYGMIYMV